MADRVYMDPMEDGAPQVGDVVVVVVDGAPDPGWSDTVELVGRLGVVVEDYRVVGRHLGNLALPGGHQDAVHSVRRPTEAELAQWALESPGYPGT